MIKEMKRKIKEFKYLKNYPKKIYYKGDANLLKYRKVSIVGTRHPNSYTNMFTHKLSSNLAKRGVKIVSGAAIGVDAIAHKSAGHNNTIAVVANGLNIRYPAINTSLIKDIEKNGLIISCYEENEKARNYTFVHRNELVVALGEVLIVTQADLKSGSLTSINYALKMGKKVYTIPHRLDESLGTQKFVEEGLIEPIYNLENFLEQFGSIKNETDSFIQYIKSMPPYEEAIKLHKDKIFELELEGQIKVENGFIKPI